jgi:hypothetical protein
VTAYTVFPFKVSGVAPMFAFIEHDDDRSAVAEALTILRQHSSATRVTLCREDQVIFHGLSSECSAWLASGKHREAGCPVLHASDGPCPPNCRG